MKALVFGLVCLVACKGKDTGTTGGTGGTTTPIGSPVVTVKPVVPKVAATDVTAGVAPNDLATVFIAADGKIALGPSLTGPPSGRKALDLDTLRKLVHESVAFGRPVKDAIEYLGSAEDLASRNNPDPTSQDDPPPPEEDDDEESGGTGTAMALDEGKMGKKDSDRAEGQYRMQKNVDEPKRGSTVGPTGGGFAQLTRDKDDLVPVRGGIVLGAPIASVHAHLPVLIAADPTAKAGVVVQAIYETSGSIAVDIAGETRVLRVQFFDGESRGGYDAGEKPWIEVRATTSEIAMESVPAVAVTSTWDAAAIAKTYKALAALPKNAGADLQVLVGDDLDAQHLVDLIVALDRAGAPTIAFGHVWKKDDPQWSVRGKAIHEARLASFNAVGDLDKMIIRRIVKTAQPAITKCYEAGLLKKSDLSGTVQVTFFITPKGRVQSAKGTGVDSTVASCIASVVTTLEFPKPKGGGGVQVNYPFVLKTL